MGIAHVKNWARILARAGVPGFIVGAHGTGKTSGIYQVYQEGAAEAGKPALPAETVAKAMVASGAEQDTSITVDARVLSSLDGKHLARAHTDLDEYGFWSMSAPNISIEEIIGMPHVDDRGAVFRDAYFRSQDAAAQLLTARAKGLVDEDSGLDTKFDSVDAELEALTHKIFDRNCRFLGITERDRNDIVLRYLRLHALMPDPRHRGGGVWLVDELNRGFQEVEKALMQLLLERRYLDYVLPDNIWMCTTMNPPGGAYQVREMDAATLDRGALITITSQKEEWIEWATKRGLSEASRAFVNKHDELLNKSEDDIDLGSIDNPGTYRSVEWADRAYSVMTKNEVAETGLSIAMSLLGREAGTIYHKTVTENVHHPLTAEEVVQDYGWNPEMTQEQVEDFKSWRVTKVRSRLKGMVNKTNVKTELLQVTLAELKEWVSDLNSELEQRGSTKNNPKHTHEEKGQVLNLMMFLNDIPPDLARKFIQDDIDDMFFRVMYFAGKYPVCKVLYDKIETAFKEQAKAGDKE